MWGRWTRRVFSILFLIIAYYVIRHWIVSGEAPTSVEAGKSLLGFCQFLAPFIQLIRFPLLSVVLLRAEWGNRVWIASVSSWFISLASGTLVAIPLINLHIRLSYDGSYLSLLQAKGVLIGHLQWNGWEFGIPDYFVALMLAILVDIFVLWAFALFRKAAFKPSLRAALIVNAAIYIPVTLLFLMPYFWHKLGW